MSVKEIKVGKIKEKDLVELYGSDAQKQSYEENGHFTSNYKNALLKQVSRYCDISDCGDRTYRIRKIYTYPLPPNYNKMTKSLYQYIIPLLLNSLIDGHDEHNKIDITIGKWARMINMVNHNYFLVKYNKEETSKETQFRLGTINEFYDKADEAIDRYITTALDYLKSAGLILWRDVYRINQEASSETITIDAFGHVTTDINIESHQASKEEMEFYSKCVDIADRVAGIEHASERYYSNKSQAFDSTLKKELYKKKIKLVYKTYEAYYINLDKCKYLLSQFGPIDVDALSQQLSEEFTNTLITNAEKRFENRPDKYFYYHDKEDYILCFQGLCEIVIQKDTEYLGQRIRKKTIDDDYQFNIVQKKGD